VLFSASHPTRAGNQSNVLATAADFSEASCEDMIVQIMGATNDRGIKIKLVPQSLHVPRQTWFEANRVLQSVLQNDTANNAVNVLKATNALPKGIKVNHYFTDTDAWFIRTNAPKGPTLFQRRALEFTKDNEFSTENAMAKATERYSVYWGDWQGRVRHAGRVSLNNPLAGDPGGRRSTEPAIPEPEDASAACAAANSISQRKRAPARAPPISGVRGKEAGMATQGFTNFPKGFAGGLNLRGMPLVQTQPGAVFWVSNASTLLVGQKGGSDGNRGTYDAPFSTLAGALTACTAGRGDIIFVKPGHAETISSASILSLNVAGVAIVGLGSGSNRPTLTFTTATPRTSRSPRRT
jgi:hypothetical protein